MDAEAFPCHTAIFTSDWPVGHTCTSSVVDDGQPCRTGIGICNGGVCATPECSAPPVSFNTAICGTSEDCFINNPCVDFSCPHPDEDECLYTPKVDGTRCAEGKVCTSGVCCLDKTDAACATDSDCAPIEQCTQGACVHAVCVFTRSQPGDACDTSDKQSGRCVVQSPGDVPRCLSIP